jgi:hypothetical protein
VDLDTAKVTFGGYTTVVTAIAWRALLKAAPTAATRRTDFFDANEAVTVGQRRSL